MSSPYNPNPESAPSPIIREVPKITPMFDGPMFQPDLQGRSNAGQLTRPWLLFFEQWPGSAGQQIYLRTLLIKDTTVGVNIADNVPIYQSGTGLYVVAVLRAAISADLVVNINLNAVAVCTITIPAATPVYPNPGCVIFTDFLTAGQLFAFDPTATPPTADVLGATIIASDGSIVADGVASFTVMWQGDSPAAI